MGVDAMSSRDSRFSIMRFRPVVGFTRGGFMFPRGDSRALRNAALSANRAFNIRHLFWLWEQQTSAIAATPRTPAQTAETHASSWAVTARSARRIECDKTARI